MISAHSEICALFYIFKSHTKILRLLPVLASAYECMFKSELKIRSLKEKCFIERGWRWIIKYMQGDEERELKNFDLRFHIIVLMGI
jgi:hypothetical protein